MSTIRRRPSPSASYPSPPPSSSSSPTKFTQGSSTKAPTSSRTTSWDELPEWLKDNEYIRMGYRRIQYSYKGCAEAAFCYLHNETVNIHTHLFGALLFLLLLATYQSQTLHTFIHPAYPVARLANSSIGAGVSGDIPSIPAITTHTFTDAFMVTLFLGSAVWCLTGSAFFHAVQCHSEEVAEQAHCIDYSGIVVLIVGSFFPCIYYSFWCDPHLQFLYTSAIVIAGFGAAYTVLAPAYSTPAYRGTRTAVFVGLGLCGIVPVTHAFLSHGFTTLDEEMGFRWLLISAGLYIAGALLYANRIPEKFAPGRFDYFFASHQIFHVCVVLAALAHYRCVLTAQAHWHSTRLGVCH